MTWTRGALDRYELDTVGRLMHAHGIDSCHAAAGLGITVDEAIALVDHGVVPNAIDDCQRARLARVLNFLLRIEYRLGSSNEIRRAIELPLACIGNRSPADLLGGSEDDLRLLRAAVNAIEAPVTKWWRVGH